MGIPLPNQPQEKVVEKIFGILACRFKVLQSPMQQKHRVLMHVVMVCVILHNLLQMQSRKGHSQLGNMDLNVDGVLQWNHLYLGQNPMPFVCFLKYKLYACLHIA